MTGDWYEVWANETNEPPYILLVVARRDAFEVIDPAKGYAVVFEASRYDAVTSWLWEDEFTHVVGRQEPIESSQ